MGYIRNENLVRAYELSDEIISHVPYDPDRMIDTNRIVEYVKASYCPTIELYSTSFANITYSGRNVVSIQDCGAMMQIDYDASQKTLKAVTIVLNSDMPPTFQRFSLMQQIGLLLTIPPDVHVNQDNFYVSAHISYSLKAMDDMADDYDLLRAQTANIFALRVLMPSKQFYRVMRELGNTQAVAMFFGVTDDAVLSRMMIGA